MDKVPLVSIVIPAFNAQRFIERTLCSALAQTHQHLEVIVIDDGSTDQTRAIAERIAADDRRVQVITVANGGVARARNRGLEVATADLVAFLDADDLWHKTKIQHQVAALQAAPEAAAAYTLMRIIDVNDYLLSKGGGLVCRGYMFTRHLYAKPVGNGSALLVRRSKALEVGGYEPCWADQGIGGCEDVDFELRLAAKYPLTVVPLHLVGYRVYPGNMSSDSLRMSKASRLTMEHHLEAHPELPRWVKRQVRAATVEYGAGVLAAHCHWRLWLIELARLFPLDSARSFRIFGKQLVRSTLRRVSELSPNISEKLSTLRHAEQFKPPPGTRFYDVTPEDGLELCEKLLMPRNRQMIGRLETVDAELASLRQLSRV